jgi:lysophospholipase L1-like esterase
MTVDSMLVGIYKDTYSPEDMAHINRTLSYLTHIQEDAAAIGAETIIVILPPKEQINLSNPDEPADLPSTQPQDLLKGYCKERGMICVDLLPALKEAAQEQSPYLSGNIHFNEYGHRIAAAEIEKAIIELETTQ